jgi:hypothetical protein
MKTRPPHDGGALTLLVQLFGRDILDRLSRAGFDGAAAIAGAGPERLAVDSGISASQARRIIAVVQEMLGPSVAPLTSTEKEPAGPAAHPKRRRSQTRRPAARAQAPKPEAEPPPAGADMGDPFVDDVALVAWMGFSSNATTGRPPFSVADGILDPARRESPAREDSRRIGALSPPPSPVTSVAGTLAQSQEERAPQGADAARPARARTLPGSFWSFGRAAAPNPAPDDAIARPPGRSPDSEEPAGAPPRRDRHDH